MLNILQEDIYSKEGHFKVENGLTPVRADLPTAGVNAANFAKFGSVLRNAQS